MLSSFSESLVTPVWHREADEMHLFVVFPPSRTYSSFVFSSCRVLRSMETEGIRWALSCDVLALHLLKQLKVPAMMSDSQLSSPSPTLSSENWNLALAKKRSNCISTSSVNIFQVFLLLLLEFRCFKNRLENVVKKQHANTSAHHEEAQKYSQSFSYCYFKVENTQKKKKSFQSERQWNFTEIVHIFSTREK